MIDRQTIYLVLLLLNVVFVMVIWHMNVNFVAKRFGQKKTKGMFRIDTGDAHRYSEYVAIAAFLLTDVLFIWLFLR